MHEKPRFKDLFKKYRLRSGIATLSDLTKELVNEGWTFEESLLSRWQGGSRIPRDRKVLLALIRIFIKREGITTIREANELLESADQGYITESEISNFNTTPTIDHATLSPEKLLDFTIAIGKSKRLIRSGWVREKIKDPESVAEHSFRVSILAMTLADKLGLDKEKLIQMAILHDLGELITGDLVWSRGKIIDLKKRQDKEELEKKGIKKIFSSIGKGQEYIKLYEEMIERITEEAKFFWQLDKLEMAIQALEYESSDKKNLEEFFINADLQIDSPYLKKVMSEIFRLRKYKNN